MSNLPVRPITYTPDVAPFWEGSGRRELVLPRCRACGFVIWYPRIFCPECAGTDVDWFEATGRGVVYSFSIARNGQGPWKDVAPYVLAYVDLHEGPRILTNIVDCAVDGVTVGMAVHVVWDPIDAKTALPRFAPDV